MIEKLKDGGSYEFRVSALNGVGTSGWTQSDPIAAVSMFKVPEPPRLPKIEEVTRYEVILTWQEPVFDGGASISKYTVEKKEKVGQRWTPVGETEPAEKRIRVRRLMYIQIYIYIFFVINRFRSLALRSAYQSCSRGLSPIIPDASKDG